MQGAIRAVTRCLALAIAALTAVAAGPAAAEIHSVSAATATLRPEGLPSASREVELPFRWDREYPGRGGTVSYRITLPPGATLDGGPLALLLSGVGNQAAISLNGTVVARLGILGERGYDASKASHLIRIPAALLHAGQPDELLIEATVQRQRGAGLSAVRYGSEAAIEPLEAAQRRWRHTSSIGYAVSLLLMGGLAAGLWWRQRDALYGCFSLAAFSGVIRNLDRAWLDVPVPWPLWGAMVAVGYACHIGFIARFVLLVLDRNPPWLVRTIHTVLGTAVVLACASFGLARPALWTASLILLQLTSMACLPLVLREAFVARRRIAWVLVAAGTLAVTAGAHDLLAVRIGLFGGAEFTLTSHAMFFFVLILGGVVIERYSRSVTDYRALNANLAERVAEREQQLRGAFEELRAQQQEQAVLIERQRIMREIHDGVGSQLVGLLNMVTQRGSSTAVLEEHVKLALDEMRMAVDSLQPTHDDLATMLATLRYRLQPRLDAAGIALDWDVAAIPPVASFTAQVALQFQRILLEAFTNVLKHARASRIFMHASWRDGAPPRVRIVLTDNGVGIQDAPAMLGATGHGTANMRARAMAIGATLRIEAGADGGTSVVLDWPCHPA
ncbi:MULTISPECIES: ATP-binding protein [unclassified Variovorax]|uniref:sensor histidine kinase n=1 Tax=unclassified Variovorax TaxID=663243 RepID=UPI003ED16673